MNIKQCMGRGCYLYIVEAISNEKGPSLNKYLVLVEFNDVFPMELPRFPCEREIDFTIEIKPGLELTLKTPYRTMAP